MWAFCQKLLIFSIFILMQILQEYSKLLLMLNVFMQFSTKYTSIMHSEPIVHYWMLFTSEIKTLERLITWCELFCKVLIYVHVSKQTFFSVPYLYYWHRIVYLGFCRWRAVPLCHVSRASYKSNHCNDVRMTSIRNYCWLLHFCFCLGLKR